MRNKLLFKPYILFVALACILFTGCSEEETYYDPVKFPVVEIEQIGTLNENSATVSFTPNSLTSYFVYAIGSDTDFENFENGTLTTRRHPGNEALEFTFEYLDPSTSYVIFARGYNSNDEAGAVSSMKIKTVTDAFSVETQFIMDKSAGFTISHTDDYYKFQYYLGKPGEAGKFEELANDTAKALSECIEKAPKYSRYFFELTPGTDYVFYVRGYDRSNVPTKIYEVPFTTKIEDSCPGIYDFKINSMDLYVSNFTYTFNDKTSKAALVIEELQNYDIMFDSWRGDIFGMLKTWSNLGNTSTINTADKVFNLSRQTSHLLISDGLDGRSPFDYPFTVYVLLFDEDGQPYGVDRVKYTSPSFNPDAGDADVSVEVVNIGSSAATYNFFPNEHTNCFFFETFYAKYIDEGIDIKGDTVGVPSYEKILQHLIEGYFWYGNTPATYTENTTDYTDIDLYVIVAPVNENGLIDGVKELKRIKYTAK